MEDIPSASSEVRLLDVRPIEAATIADLAYQLAATSPTAQPEQFLRVSRSLVDGHPALDRIRAALGERPSALRISGLHAGTTEPTPTAPLPTFESVRIPAATLGLVSSIVGRHRGFERESSGRLIHSVAPSWINRDLQISSSSSVELEMHTELAYAQHMPEFVLLLCVKQGPQAPATLVAPLPDIVRELSDDVLRTLYEPRFMTSVDVVVRGRPEPKVGPLPVLCGEGIDNVRIRCDFGEAESTDRASEEALAALRCAAKRCMCRVVLDEGDLLVLDNKRAMHGRLPFEARFDGSDRWLLRSYVWARDNSATEMEVVSIVPGTLVA